MQLAILIFDDLTVLDAVGPYEVLSRVPGVDVHFVAPEPGPKRSDNGRLALVADHAIADIPAPGIVLVPGGRGELRMRADDRVLDWLRRAHETTQYTTSVCTGSLVLAAAGLLDGVRATTHWTGMDELGRLGAIPVAERVVQSGKDRDRGGGVLGNRHGAHARCRARRARRRAGDPAVDRIRPATTVRRRVTGHGAHRDRRAPTLDESVRAFVNP
jgi:putative intracellular protease/amidase